MFKACYIGRISALEPVLFFRARDASLRAGWVSVDEIYRRIGNGFYQPRDGFQSFRLFTKRGGLFDPSTNALIL